MKEKLAGISRDAWMEALETVTKPEYPDALPICEIADKWGISRGKARLALDRMMAQGMAKRVRTRRRDVTGRDQNVTGYILIDKK